MFDYISIPSENCPHCGIKGGYCRVLWNGMPSVREWSIKIDETEIRAQMFGKYSPTYREAYQVQSFICLQGKGPS